MAPAASIRSATSAAAASKRPAASDADHPVLHHQGDDEAKQQQRQQLECPRCQSTNTKFCYYNNYSTAQPRHFCRACRRYWTHGGTLRDVPVGGASRRTGTAKRRRRDPSSPPSSASPPAVGDAARHQLLMPPDLSSAAFPFLSDGSFFLPPLQPFDLGAAAPAAFASWQSAAVPDFYDGLAPWDDGTTAGVTAAWGDIAAGLELTWPPPGN